MSGQPVGDEDEQIHPADPAVSSWNESWFFSWIDLDGGPAGFFRVGVLPNQRRAMLWCFMHVDGEWLAIEESRLGFEDLATSVGLSYDKWALQFAWTPDKPVRTGRFTAQGAFRARSGNRSGAVVPVSIDLTYDATSDCYVTGEGDDVEHRAYPTNRFEQSLSVSGSVTVGGISHEVHAGGHRDRSWGPREWRQAFTIGDVQSTRQQIYFVGRGPGLGVAYLRRPDAEVQTLFWSGGEVHYDDERRTFSLARLELTDRENKRLDLELRPIGPSVCFDMAHATDPPEHWLYWRHLVEARIAGQPPARGWFEASRYSAINAEANQEVGS